MAKPSAKAAATRTAKATIRWLHANHARSAAAALRGVNVTARGPFTMTAAVEMVAGAGGEAAAASSNGRDTAATSCPCVARRARSLAAHTAGSAQVADVDIRARMGWSTVRRGKGRGRVASK